MGKHISLDIYSDSDPETDRGVALTRVQVWP